MAKVENDTVNRFHPVVRKWIKSHRAKQIQQKRDLRAHGRNAWFGSRALHNLTVRDWYRFEQTSHFFKLFEARGGLIVDAPVSGKFKLEVLGEILEFTIREKMLRGLKRPSEEQLAWTAYTSDHSYTLFSSGFLRFKVDTYCRDLGQPERIEKTGKLADAFLPEVIDKLWVCAKVRRDWAIERDQDRERYRLRQIEEDRSRRRAEQEAKDWSDFRDMGAIWKEAQILREFLAAVKNSPKKDALHTGDVPIEVWIKWAERRIEELDPLSSTNLKRDNLET